MSEPRTPRHFAAILFLVYLALLVWLVMWKFETPWIGNDFDRQIKLVPFIAAGAFGASRPLEVLANVVIFVPFGVYLALLAPSWPWWRTALVAAAASTGLEIGQYAFAVGSTDVTDVIVNAGGALVGFALASRTRRMRRTQGRLGADDLARARIVRLCTIGTVVALAVTAVVVASPLQFTPADTGPLMHERVRGG
ncbi:VanZ family protein [Agromyces protaetiae]|nr:VanZ family protein [Agromyces protaetiae]